MRPSEKYLLLKELSAMLLYGVEIWHEHFPNPVTLTTHIFDRLRKEDNGEFKVYLRPMSSMTAEEKKVLKNYIAAEEKASTSGLYKLMNAKRNTINFLYSKHLDFCGLIKIGLALKAPEGMYPIK